MSEPIISDILLMLRDVIDAYPDELHLEILEGFRKTYAVMSELKEPIRNAVIEILIKALELSKKSST